MTDEPLGLDPAAGNSLVSGGVLVVFSVDSTLGALAATSTSVQLSAERACRDHDYHTSL